MSLRGQAKGPESILSAAQRKMLGVLVDLLDREPKRESVSRREFLSACQLAGVLEGTARANLVRSGIFISRSGRVRMAGASAA